MVAANSLNISETGFQSFDGVSVFKGRTLQAGTGISISNGTGVSGNPTIAAGATVPTSFNGNTGTATPAANVLNVITANSTVKFAGSGSTLTQDFSKSNLLLGASGSFINTSVSNVGVGLSALQFLTNGVSNSVLGWGAGAFLSTGNNNVFVGTTSGSQATVTQNNTAVGSLTLGNYTTGAALAGSNTAVGFNSLHDLTTGINNTCLGSQSGTNYTSSESSNIAIGNIGTVSESNTIRIGTAGSGTGQQNRNFQAGITGVTVAGSPVAVSSTGQLSDLGFGTAAQVLTSNGAGVSPTWQAAGSSGTTCIFSAYRSSYANNVTGDGTLYTIPFDTAVINLSSSYNTGTGVFTAPTTGNYLFSSTVNIEGLLSGHTEGIFSFNGSNYECRFARYNMGAMATSGIFSASGSVIIPMTAGQTMSVFVYVVNSTKVVDVVGSAAPVFYTNFSGYLIP